MVTQVETPISIPDAAPSPYPTAEDIIVAFRTHGIKPAAGSLFGVDRDEAGRPIEACAVGVLSFDRGGNRIATDLTSAILNDVSSTYLEGIAHAFDGLAKFTWFHVNDQHYHQGYEVGAAVRRWAFGSPQ